MMKSWYVYVLKCSYKYDTKKRVYVGFTGDPDRRMGEHEEGGSKRSYTKRFEHKEIGALMAFEMKHQALLMERWIKTGKYAYAHSLVGDIDWTKDRATKFDIKLNELGGDVVKGFKPVVKK